MTIDFGNPDDLSLIAVFLLIVFSMGVSRGRNEREEDDDANGH